MNEKLTAISQNNLTIAENEQKVFEAGKKSEYDRFWDIYQDNGDRVLYSYSFAGYGWTDETFKPKYDIVASGVVVHMFSSSRITDLAESLNRAGVTLDVSKVTKFNYFMSENSFTVRIPILNTTSSSDLSYFFYSNKNLKIIDEVILKSDGSQVFTNYSFRLDALEEIRFSGTIGKNGFNVQWSKNLSHESLMSIINALKDYSADTSGTTWLVTLGSTNLAKLTTDELKIIENKGWYYQ